MNLQIRAAVSFLVSQAERDNDPMTYANMILDQVDPDVVSQLIDAPDWFDKLAAFNAKVKQHPQWFGELRDAIRELLTLPPDGGISPENNPGTPNAAPGAS